MKLSDWLLLFTAHQAHKAAKKAAAPRKQRRARSAPFEATVHIRVPFDGDADELDEDEILSRVNIAVPPGVTIDSIDIDAQIVDDDESAASAAGGFVLPPDPGDSCGFPDLSAMSRSERRAYNREQNRRMDRRARELVELLENHSPEEAERILWRRFSESE